MMRTKRLRIAARSFAIVCLLSSWGLAAPGDEPTALAAPAASTQPAVTPASEVPLTDRPAPVEPPREPVQFGVGVYGGAALDRGGFVVGINGRARLSPRWIIGLSAEWAPFFDIFSGDTAPGVVNAYGSLTWTWFSTPVVELRSIAHVGASALLFEPVGTRRGAVGVFLGLCLLGVSLKLSEHIVLDLTPEATLEIPSLTGVPFVYRQYRFVITVARWL